MPSISRHDVKFVFLSSKNALIVHSTISSGVGLNKVTLYKCNTFLGFFSGFSQDWGPILINPGEDYRTTISTI